MRQRVSPRRTAVLIGSCFLLFLFFKNAEIAANGIEKGLVLASGVIIPSLFPFLVLSELLLASNAGEISEKLLGGAVRRAFAISGKGALAFLMGVLCGIPVGAVTATSLQTEGEITRDEFERLFLFVNLPSAAFLISAVGGTLFGCTQAGIALFVIMLLCAMLTGVLLRCFAKKREMTPPCPTPIAAAPLGAATVTGCLKKGFTTLLYVIAFLLFFSALGECLRAIIKELALPDTVGVLLCGILEMTSGISLAITTLNVETAFLLTAFFCGFSGLSICLQVFAVSEKVRPHLAPYLIVKLAQGLLALLLAALYYRLFRPALAPPTEHTFATLGKEWLPARMWIGAALSLSLLFLLYLLQRRLVCFVKRKKGEC